MRERADYQNTFSLAENEGRNLIIEADDLRKRICDYVVTKLETDKLNSSIGK